MVTAPPNCGCAAGLQDFICSACAAPFGRATLCCPWRDLWQGAALFFVTRDARFFGVFDMVLSGKQLFQI